MSDAGEGNDRYTQLLSDVSDRAKQVGLYLETAILTKAPHDPDAMVVVATFLIGDRAFQPAVQDPEQARFDESFRVLRLDAEEADSAAEIDALRRMLYGDDQ